MQISSHESQARTLDHLPQAIFRLSARGRHALRMIVVSKAESFQLTIGTGQPSGSLASMARNGTPLGVFLHRELRLLHGKLKPKTILMRLQLLEIMSRHCTRFFPADG
jgi:hypothetical protein